MFSKLEHDTFPDWCLWQNCCTEICTAWFIIWIENNQYSWSFVISICSGHTTPAESFLDEEERQYEEAEEKVGGDSEEVSEPALAAGPAPAQPPEEVQPERDVGPQHGHRPPGHPGHVAQLPPLPGGRVDAVVMGSWCNGQVVVWAFIVILLLSSLLFILINSFCQIPARYTSTAHYSWITLTILKS